MTWSSSAALDRHPLAALQAQFLDQLVDVRIGDLDHLALDLELVQRLQVDLRQDLDGRGVLERRAGLDARALDLRCAGRVQVLLRDRLRVRGSDQVAEQFLADLGTVLLFDDLERRLARAEALEPGAFADRLQSVAQFLVDGLGRDLDAELALEFVVGGFYRDLHGSPVATHTVAPTLLVRKERLELSRVAPLGPKPSASTNSATFAAGFTAAIISSGVLPRRPVGVP